MAGFLGNNFVGPCAHGRDPYDRCDHEDDPIGGGCSNLSPVEAEKLALQVQAAVNDEHAFKVKALQNKILAYKTAIQEALDSCEQNVEDPDTVTINILKNALK